MRLVLGCAVVLALACGVTLAGQAKVDPKLLFGKWEPAPEKEKPPEKGDRDKDKDKEKKAPPPPAGPAMVIEFNADGKTMSLTVSDMGKDHRVQGAYKLEADKLIVEMKLGDRDVKETLTIKSLTQDLLVTEDSKNKTETLRRRK